MTKFVLIKGKFNAQGSYSESVVAETLILKTVPGITSAAQFLDGLPYFIGRPTHPTLSKQINYTHTDTQDDKRSSRIVRSNSRSTSLRRMIGKGLVSP